MSIDEANTGLGSTAPRSVTPYSVSMPQTFGIATCAAYLSRLRRRSAFRPTITNMAVLVGTHDGYHVFSSSGAHDHTLAGHDVDALTPGPAGTWVAIVDGDAVWQHGTDAAWSPLSASEHTLVSLTTAADVIFAGTDDARVLRRAGAELVPLAAFDHAPSREEWHQVGPPIQVRSLTSTCDGKVVLANVHVGGILRSTDGGESWHPTMPVDNDVHEVSAHPDRPEVVVAAAAVGLLRSHDAGATWDLETRGLPGTYCRGIAAEGDDLYISVAPGPMAHRASVYRANVDAGTLDPVTAGLPDRLEGMIDTRFVAARNGTVAVASRAGHVWARGRAAQEWQELATTIDGITCVAAM
jgi:hypothetical protein